MSWVGWNRPSDSFHLTLTYGAEESAAAVPDRLSTSSSSSSVSGKDLENGVRVEFNWSGGDDEDQVVLRMQSHLMVSAPSRQDSVSVQLTCVRGNGDSCDGSARGGSEEVGEEVVRVAMGVEKRREELKGVRMGRKPGGSGKEGDGGAGIFTRLLRWDFTGSGVTVAASGGGVCGEHWRSLAVVSLCGCGLSVSSFLQLLSAN